MIKTTGNKAWDQLIQNESSWKTTAKNPKSSAFGLGQLLIGTRRDYARKLRIENPHTTDAKDQLRMMHLYIQERYGTPEKALAFWNRRVPINGKDVGHWY